MPIDTAKPPIPDFIFFLESKRFISITPSTGFSHKPGNTQCLGHFRIPTQEIPQFIPIAQMIRYFPAFSN